jgi:hypothetical protein
MACARPVWEHVDRRLVHKSAPGGMRSRRSQLHRISRASNVIKVRLHSGAPTPVVVQPRKRAATPAAHRDSSAGRTGSVSSAQPVSQVNPCASASMGRNKTAAQETKPAAMTARAVAAQTNRTTCVFALRTASPIGTAFNDCDSSSDVVCISMVLGVKGSVGSSPAFRACNTARFELHKKVRRFPGISTTWQSADYDQSKSTESLRPISARCQPICRFGNLIDKISLLCGTR